VGEILWLPREEQACYCIVQKLPAESLEFPRHSLLLENGVPPLAPFTTRA